MSENLNETNQAVEEQEAAPSAETPAEGTAETAAPEAEAAAEGEVGTGTAAAGETEAESGAEGAEAGEAAADGETDGEAAAETETAAEEGEGEEVRRAEFSPIAAAPGSSVKDNLDLILGVTVPVTIELGSTEMFFRDVMALGPGAVVRLDRPVGDPVDLLVNGEPVGRGEVVVVDERYGVRVTELCRPGTAAKEEK